MVWQHSHVIPMLLKSVLQCIMLTTMLVLLLQLLLFVCLHPVERLHAVAYLVAKRLLKSVHMIIMLCRMLELQGVRRSVVLRCSLVKLQSSLSSSLLRKLQLIS